MIISDRMPVSQSTFTFLVKPGSRFTFGLEAFYFNNKTQELEPLSAASKSTPRCLKKPFGAITGLTVVDNELFEINNFNDEKIVLTFSKLAPLLERNESMIKNTLVAVYDKGLGTLISTLNTLIQKFHSEDRCVTVAASHPPIPHPDTSLPGTSLPDTSLPDTPIKKDPLGSSPSTRIESVSKPSGSGPPSRSQSINLLAEDGGEETEYESDEDNISSPKKRARMDQSEILPQATNFLDVNDNNEHPTESIVVTEEVSIMERINEVIDKARYKSVNSDWCEVPAGVKVNRDLVNQLKVSLRNHPDRTQCFLGVVCVGDKDDNMIGPFHVYVNPELFLALRELRFEGFSLGKGDYFPAIVHEIDEKDDIDHITLGMFLNKNSKEFSDKIRETMTYQDLIRFCCQSTRNLKKGSEAEVKSYLKNALQEFSKGRPNSTLFISFAFLPVTYQDKFIKFLELFETGSLPGQKLSSRQLCNIDKKRQRKKSFKLEMPVSVVKLHMKISQAARGVLIDEILAKKITFSEYCARLKKAAEMIGVKKQVEMISKESFTTVVEKHPGFFCDKEMEKYIGARNTPSGQNEVYTSLVNHVNVALSNQRIDSTSTSHQPAVFSHSDNLNLYSLVNKMKTFRTIILGSDECLADGLYCVTERIRDSNDAVGILVNVKDEKKVKEDLILSFMESEVLVETIQVKRKVPMVENGFMKTTESLLVFGDKSCFKDKAIKTLYGVLVKEALQFIISDLVVGNEKVLYCFAKEDEAFDLDPMGTLARKKIQIEYLSGKSLIEPLSVKLSKKVAAR